MHIELTEQDRLRAQQGEPVDVVDPQSNVSYVLITRQRFEQVRSMLTPQTTAPAAPEQTVPEGVRLSRDTYRRELPELLKQKKLYQQWVAYHRDQRLGVAKSKRTLLIECFARGLPDDEFYVGWIHEYGLIEEEEVEMRLHHFVGFDDEDT